MGDQIITIDYRYKYVVDDILAGGMGHVLLLSLIPSGLPFSLTDVISRSSALQHQFKYPYKDKLAAKTVLPASDMAAFARECNLWLEFNETGIVPLLKVVKVREQVLALMPRYSGNLRDLLVAAKTSPQHLLHSLYEPVAALSALHRRLGVVHQDIKPENILYSHENGRLTLSVSDWGIANLQAALLPSTQVSLSEFAIATMRGFGTLPYMAPERFASYLSNIRADIFSLGIVIFEILTGHLPYSPNSTIAHQLISGEYYDHARESLIHLPHNTSRILLSMIHPLESMRPDDYSPILRQLLNHY